MVVVEKITHPSPKCRSIFLDSDSRNIEHLSRLHWSLLISVGALDLTNYITLGVLVLADRISLDELALPDRISLGVMTFIGV